ncbi:MAG: transglutaminase [bacterium]|nr:MAG: transglutaminase [bacterium]
MVEARQSSAIGRSVESQRLDAFVDSAFAFAVSLLIIAGAEPLRSFDDLLAALARIPAFACAFALIILFWLAHRTWSSLSPARDGRATALSLAVVFAVLVFVFPLRLLTDTATHFISGGLLPGRGLISSFDELRWTYVIYGIGFSILSGLYALLFRQAQRAIDPADVDRTQAARQWERTWMLSAATGLASGGIACTSLVAAAPWLPGVTYQLIPIGIGLFALRDRLRRRAA